VIFIKLFSPRLELRVLAEICNTPKSLATNYLLSRLTPNHFNYEPTVAGFNRIKKLLETTDSIPSYIELESDPTIDEDLREILSANEDKKNKLKDEDRAKSRFEVLDKYRKKREVYFLAKNTIEELKKSSVDIDNLLLKMSDKLAVARAAVNHQDELVHFGKGNNSSGVVKNVLFGESDPTIPTGFKTFDEKNGGFFKQSVAIMSSNSSGGKSVAALQVAVNMYYAGFSTCVLSLEMSEKQYTARFLSNISGVEFSKIIHKKMDKKELKQVTKAYREFVEFGKKNNVRWTILAPKTGLSLDQLLMTVKPYKYDVITIDYLSLLEEADTDNQARALASITRRCKVFTQTAGCLMILLAQLSDEGLIKYSRAIKENADHVWTWTYSDTERETHLITMRVDKGRNQVCFPFEVQEDYARMRLVDTGNVKDFDESTVESNHPNQDDDDYLAEDQI